MNQTTRSDFHVRNILYILYISVLDINLHAYTNWFELKMINNIFLFRVVVKVLLHTYEHLIHSVCYFGLEMHLTCFTGMKGRRRSIKYEIHFSGSSAGKFTVNYLTFLYM